VAIETLASKEGSFYSERRAGRAVQEAVKRGELPPARTLKCANCGAPAAHYHHWHGYAPEHLLDVQPLCVPCHGACPKRSRAAVPPPRQLADFAGRTGRLRQFRLAAGFTQEELASAIGVTAQLIYSIERGGQTARPDTMRRVALAFNVPIPAITEFSEQIDAEERRRLNRRARSDADPPPAPDA
jgi:DNA-binding XRE family transcriptional regulator